MATGALVQRREDPGGTHEWVETEPSPRLGPWITGYSGYREARHRPVLRLETPSAGAILVLSFGDPLMVSQPAPSGAGTPVPRMDIVTSFAGGITDRPVLTTHQGRQHGVQVRLDPLALFSLFGVPLDELDRQPGGVTDLTELGAAHWGERLGAHPSWAARLALLDELLAAQLARRAAVPDPEVVHAWRRLRSSRGGVRVADLVHESSVSHPTFVRRFRRHVGIGPKAAARVLRYQHATALLDGGRRTLAEIAARCGYADQAHLDREFAALAGRSPTRLARERAGPGYQSIPSILYKTEAAGRLTVTT